MVYGTGSEQSLYATIIKVNYPKMDWTGTIKRGILKLEARIDTGAQCATNKIGESTKFVRTHRGLDCYHISTYKHNNLFTYKRTMKIIIIIKN